MMIKSLSLFLVFLLIGSTIVEAKTSRKERRRLRILQSYGIVSAKALEEDAIKFIAEGNTDMAIHRYRSLYFWHQKYKPEKTLQVLTALYFKNGEPIEALEHAEVFAEKYPDSELITELVQVCYEVGKRFCLGRDRNYQKLHRYSKAIRAFEYVVKHDPYSIEAAESLMAHSSIFVLRRDWEEALLLLQEIEQKQPGSEIAARSEVMIARCFLGMNKGGEYSPKNIEQSIRYLESYLRRYENGIDRKEAKELLSEAYKRKGVLELKTIRYYCTARKWDAAMYYVDDLLKQKNLASTHAEAKELKQYIQKKLK